MGCSEGITRLVTLPMRSSLTKAGTEVPSLPETDALFNTTADLDGPGYAMAGVSASGFLESYFDQRTVALPRPNTLSKASQILII